MVNEPLLGLFSAIAIALGGWNWNLYRGNTQRIAAVELRLHSLELEVNKDFLTKADFREVMTEIKDHMLRIEHKLDTIHDDRQR